MIGAMGKMMWLGAALLLLGMYSCRPGCTGDPQQVPEPSGDWFSYAGQTYLRGERFCHIPLSAMADGPVVFAVCMLADDHSLAMYFDERVRGSAFSLAPGAPSDGMWGMDLQFHEGTVLYRGGTLDAGLSLPGPAVGSVTGGTVTLTEPDAVTGHVRVTFDVALSDGNRLKGAWTYEPMTED